jgi:hypothetical protein
MKTEQQPHDYPLNVMPITIFIGSVIMLLLGLIPVALVLFVLSLLLGLLSNNMVQARNEINEVAKSKTERDISVGFVTLLGILIGLPLIYFAFTFIIYLGPQ